MYFNSTFSYDKLESWVIRVKAGCFLTQLVLPHLTNHQASPGHTQGAWRLCVPSSGPSVLLRKNDWKPSSGDRAF